MPCQDGVVAGTAQFEQSTQAAAPNPLNPFNILWGGIGRLIGFILIALLLTWLLAPLIRRSGNALRFRLGSSLGWGVVTIFAIPIILIIFVALMVLIWSIFAGLSLDAISSIVTGIGIFTILGVLLTFAFIFVVVSKLVVGYWLGRLIFRNMENIVLPLLTGLIIVAILVSIPFVGWLFSILIGLLGLGGIIVARASTGTGETI